MNWWEMAKRIYQERGYLVIARISPYRIGAIIETINLADKPAVALPQPFRVRAETVHADYVAQHKLAGITMPDRPEQYHFYRIVTD